MRALASLLVLSAVALSTAAGAARAACVPGAGIGLSRIVEIDTRTGPLFGYQTRYQRTQSFLRPREVVLTFDDGPLPWITRSILDTLDNNCTKATFFSVGKMAVAYPTMVREELARGHSVGSHTWSHPLNLKRLTPEKAIDEIERGFAAVALAADRPIAPFFRFPGLNDNAALLTHLQSRGIGIFTVDAISNDSFIGDENRLIANTMAQVDARQGGIILFHDIKAATARALPVILSQLKAKGYTVVHMRSATGFEPLPQYQAQLQPILAKAQPVGKGHLVPFYGTEMRTGPEAEAVAGIPVEAVSPEAKVFAARGDERASARAAPKRPLTHMAGEHRPAAGHKVAAGSGAAHPARAHQTPARYTPPYAGWFGTAASGWVTTITTPKLRRTTAD